MDEWLKTTDAAQIAGVGTSTIKRWADEGRLQCSRTPGGHRRYRREDIESILESEGVDASAAHWLEIVSGRASTFEAELLLARSRLGAWHRVATEVGSAVELMGQRWANGEMSIVAEHRATERIRRGLASISERILVREGALAALVGVPDDPHTLGLSLVELCLREAAVESIWVGARTPVSEVVEFVESASIDLLAVSASSLSTDEERLESFARPLADVCAERGTALVLGGGGRWPRLPGTQRFTNLAEFSDFAARLAAER